MTSFGAAWLGLPLAKSKIEPPIGKHPRMVAPAVQQIKKIKLWWHIAAAAAGQKLNDKNDTTAPCPARSKSKMVIVGLTSLCLPPAKIQTREKKCTPAFAVRRVQNDKFWHFIAAPAVREAKFWRYIAALAVRQVQFNKFWCYIAAPAVCEVQN